MKIACVLGSPKKKGNSTTLARHFLKTAEKLGAECRSFYLNGLHYQGCQACFGCKTKSDRCVVKDDLTEVLEAVREADVLVLATGTYFGEITGQLKCFVDRTFSFLVPDFHDSPQPSRLAPGKKLVFIVTQAQPNENLFADIFPRYEKFFKWYGYADTHLIRVCGAKHEDNMRDRKDIIRQVEETAQKVMWQGKGLSMQEKT